MESIAAPPSQEDFVPLSEHQQQTPGTFFGGSPVLHLHSASAKLVIAADRLSLSPTLAKLHDTNGSGNQVNGTGHEDAKRTVVISNIDIWVTSKYLILFSTDKKTGVRLFYPTIALHATRRLKLPDSPDQEISGLYTQLIVKDHSDTSADGSRNDDEPVTIDLTLVPTGVETSSVAGTGAGSASNNSTSTRDPTRALFDAISTCTALNPDPTSDEEQDMHQEEPGTGGWITADNAGDYFDNEGQFIGFSTNNQSTVPAVPTEDGGQGNDQSNGDGTSDGDRQETKWRRLD